MTTAKKAAKAVAKPTSTSRVMKLRAERAALGLKRMDVYVHDQDKEHVEALVAELQARRQQKT